MEETKIKYDRFEYLDSLRGLAAISVVISHFVLAYRLDLEFKVLNFSPVHFFYDGFAAVTLFFILSGYVLTLSLKKVENFEIGEFYLKRIFRIMPAYIFVLFISLFAYNYFFVMDTTPNTSSWIRDFWARPIDWKNFLKQIVFLDSGNYAELVPQNWSLRVEMLFSFLMPFLYLIYRKTNYIYFWVFNLIVYLFFNIPVFILHFGLGISLAFNQDVILSHFQIFKKTYRIILIGMILFLYTYRYTLPMYYYYFARSHSPILNNDDLIWVITGLGAFFLLIYCISSPKLQKILNLRWFIFIGKISYAIYLVHMLVLIFLVPTFIKLLNSFEISNKYVVWGSSLLFLIIITIVISYFIAYVIEIPIAKAGNRLIKKKLTFFSKIVQ